MKKEIVLGVSTFEVEAPDLSALDRDIEEANEAIKWGGDGVYLLRRRGYELRRKNFYCVMNGGWKNVPKCIDEKGHEFARIRPPDNSSWTEEKCKKCGVEIGYDSGD